MPKKRSRDSLARRPKDTEGPPALAHTAALVFFTGSTLLALAAALQRLLNLPSAMSARSFFYAALGICLSWLLALAASATLPRARRLLILITPFALAAIAYLATVASRAG